MECFYRGKPFDENGKPIRGHRKRMFREWRNRGMFESTEQRICDQARAIRKNGWLSDLELEMIKRSIKEEEERGVENTLEGNSEGENEENQMNDDVEENVVNNVNDREIDDQNLGNFVVEDGVLENVLTESQREIVESLKKIIMEEKTAEGISFDKKKLKCQMNRVNQVIHHIRTKDITETNNLIMAATVWVAEQLGLKKTEFRAKKEPWWKRRIDGDIKRLKQDVNLLERQLRGELGHKKKGKLQKLEDKYRVKKKGMKTVIEELKQRMIAKSAKIKRYEERINQFRQNKIFNVDQKKIYKELNGGEFRTNDIPNAEESKRYIGVIFGQ